MNSARPSSTFIERVARPARIPAAPESGLDSILGVLAPALFSAVTGLHGVGEALDASNHLTATRAHQAPPLPQAPKNLEVAQAAPTPPLSLTAPPELTLVDVPVRRDMDLLDPSLHATDPALAARYQPRPATLDEAFRRLKPAASANVADMVKESVPWRMRR